jgi:YcxB-like protein
MKAYRTRNSLLRWAFRFGVAFVIFVLGSGLALLVLAPHSSAVQNLFPLFALCIMWVFMLWVSPYFFARSQLKGSPIARGPITLNISGSGLCFHSQYAESQLAWPSFVRWLEEKAIFALFTNPKMGIPIPKRAFSADQLDEFRILLREKIEPRQ